MMLQILNGSAVRGGVICQKNMLLFKWCSLSEKYYLSIVWCCYVPDDAVRNSKVNYRGASVVVEHFGVGDSIHAF